MATTDFQDFINHILDIDLNEVNELYETINSRMNYGSYEYFEINDDKIVIKNRLNEKSLLLASQKAKQTFLDLLNQKWAGGFDDVPTKWDYLRILERDKNK